MAALPWIVACGAMSVAAIYFGLHGGANHDDVEHLAVAVRILQGEIPYRDFHQNHAPLFWYSLVPLVSTFFGTIYPLFFGRVLSVVLIGGATFLGLKLLRHLTVPRYYTFAYLFFILSLCLDLEAFRIRPDAFMVFLASVGFYAMVAQLKTSWRMAFTVGLCMGASAAFSIKMAPLLVVFPLRVLIFERPRSLVGLSVRALCYGLGIVIGLIPLVAYLHSYDIFSQFYAQVISLNANLSKDFFSGFQFRFHTYFSPLMLSMLVAFMQRHRLNEQQKILLFCAGLWVLLSYSILVLTCHATFYNFQLLLIPAAVLLVFLLNTVLSQFSASAWRLMISTWVVFHVSVISLPEVFADRVPGKSIPIPVLKKAIALTGDGEKTCIGIAPLHPIYCRNVASIMLDWDLLFFAKLKNSMGEDNPFLKYWQDAAAVAASGEVDLLVRRAGKDAWDTAHELGAISESELAAIDAQRNNYRLHQIHWKAWQIWVRKQPKTSDFN